jgi:hypothetical protein
VSRVGLGLSNPKFRVLLEKVRCEPLFIIFWGLDFDGCSSVVCLPLVSLCRIFFV